LALRLPSDGAELHIALRTSSFRDSAHRSRADGY
jgi:hypothetical protein